MSKRLAKKLLLIGWDAADWKVISPLMDAGHMPTLAGLVDRGVMGNLATLDPPFSPMLWTSIATGKTADQHGIINFIQPTEDGSGVRPVLGTSRKVKAVWNILNQSGLRSNVIGWWPSHPAEPINGVMVSNFYHRSGAHIWEEWPLAPGSVHPAELGDLFAGLRIHPAEMTANHIEPFVPGCTEIDMAEDRRLQSVIKTTAEAASVHAAATWAMEETEWDFMAVYYDAIDHYGHGFMKYHPPRRPHISEEAYERYKGVMTAGYRYHDMLLDRLLHLAGEDTTVMLISDHGFHSDHLRPTGIPQEPAGPAREHRDHGVFVMAGPGIKKDERVYGLSLLDIAPTVLMSFGLPIGKDMAGKPVAEAFETPPETEYLPSWEDVEGDDGQHASDAKEDPWAEQEALRQLEELGYIEPGQGQGPEQVEKVTRESNFYLARVHLSRGRPAEALPLLEDAFAAEPEAERYGVRLAEAYRLLNRYEDSHRTLDATLEGRETRLASEIETADKQIATLRERAEAAEAGKAPQGEPLEAEAPNTAEGEVDSEALRAKKRSERIATLEVRRKRLKARQGIVPAGFHYHRGLTLLAEGKAEDALKAFDDAKEEIDRYPALNLRLGEAYLLLKRWSEAEAAFDSALESDPHRASAHRGRALSLLRQDRPEEAAAAALEAVGLQYFFPAAHFHLGEALMRLGEHERAAEAFEVALAQNPGIKRAHFYLSELYRNYLDKPAEAAQHLRFASEQIAS